MNKWQVTSLKRIRTIRHGQKCLAIQRVSTDRTLLAWPLTIDTTCTRGLCYWSGNRAARRWAVPAERRVRLSYKMAGESRWASLPREASLGGRLRISFRLATVVEFGVDRMVAGRTSHRVATSTRRGVFGGRKVRAPQDTVMGNAHRPKGQGKCNRKQTASWASARAVRVKR